MALRLEQKQQVVEEVRTAVQQAHAAVLADYRGLNAGEMTLLRAKARDSGVYLRVVRNNLMRRAVADGEFQCLNDALAGPILLALAKDEPSSAARLLKDFAEDHEALQVKALSLGGALLDAGALERVASLPTRDEALSLLLAVMQAPIGKLARTLNEVPAKLVRTLASVRDGKDEERKAQKA